MKITVRQLKKIIREELTRGLTTEQGVVGGDPKYSTQVPVDSYIDYDEMIAEHKRLFPYKLMGPEEWSGDKVVWNVKWKDVYLGGLLSKEMYDRFDGFRDVLWDLNHAFNDRIDVEEWIEACESMGETLRSELRFDKFPDQEEKVLQVDRSESDDGARQSEVVYSEATPDFKKYKNFIRWLLNEYIDAMAVTYIPAEVTDDSDYDDKTKNRHYGPTENITVSERDGDYEYEGEYTIHMPELRSEYIITSHVHRDSPPLHALNGLRSALIAADPQAFQSRT